MSQVISHQKVYICELAEVTRSDLPCNACPGESAPQILSSLPWSTLNFPNLPWRKIHSIRYAEPKISNFGVWALYLQASQWALLCWYSWVVGWISHDKWAQLDATGCEHTMLNLVNSPIFHSWAGWYGLRFVKMQGGKARCPLLSSKNTPANIDVECQKWCFAEVWKLLFQRWDFGDVGTFRDDCKWWRVWLTLRVPPWSFVQVKSRCQWSALNMSTRPTSWFKARRPAEAACGKVPEVSSGAVALICLTCLWDRHHSCLPILEAWWTLFR